MDAHLTSLRASPSAWLFALASPKACGGPVRRFSGAVGAERADFPSVLGLAAPSRNSLRALRALRSDKRGESGDERASRWAASPARLGAPQARHTGPPHALGDELLVCGGLSAMRQCGGDSRQQSLRPGLYKAARPACRRSGLPLATPERRGRRSPVGAIWRRAEERSRRGGARSALRALTHRHCLSGAPAGRAASLAMRLGDEYRRLSARSAPDQAAYEPPPGCACRDARQRQGSPGAACRDARQRQVSPERHAIPNTAANAKAAPAMPLDRP
jgi:hypothetical protein